MPPQVEPEEPLAGDNAAEGIHDDNGTNHNKNATTTSTTIPTTSLYEHSWEPAIAAKIKAALRERQAQYHNNNTNNADTQQQQQQQPLPPYMVSLVGIPGGGKSISSLLLATFLEAEDDTNSAAAATASGVMIMPHDGYHYPMDQLRLMPDAADVIYRRGAPDTFDPSALKRDLERIRYGPEEWITVPGFDHGRGDPEPDQHAFDRNHHKVVICEGLYLLHDSDGWEDVATMFDMSIFIESDVDACVERLKVRNLCIPGYTPEEIQLRCEQVDRVNANTVMKSKYRASEVVESIAAASNGNKKSKSKHRKTPSTSLASLDLVTQQQTAMTATHSHNDHHPQHDHHTPHHHHRQHSDSSDFWMMNISARPRSDSMSSSNKPESMIFSVGDHPAADAAPEPPPASAFVGSWEADMAKTILERAKVHKEKQLQQGIIHRQPYMVALVGTPGSGKSISALLLANHLEEENNDPNTTTTTNVMVMPHDGYHYTLEYLKTFPNAEDYIYRRGAPDTFDPASLVRDLDRIKTGFDEELITLPAFDHSRGDPEPDTHAYDRSRHDIVICEGLYLLHDRDGWEDVASRFDYKIFMNSDVELCMERVKIRNQCIPGYTPEEIAERTEKVDRVNSLIVLSSKARADVLVDSLAMTSHAYENDFEHEVQDDGDDDEIEGDEGDEVVVVVEQAE